MRPRATTSAIGHTESATRDQPICQHPQQLGLRRQRHFGRLVQKKCAFVCGLENSLARAVRAGERSPLVSKQLAFQKRFGKRRTIDSDQGLFGAFGVFGSHIGTRGFQPPAFRI